SMSTDVPYSFRICGFYCRWANDLCKLSVGGNAMSHCKVKADSPCEKLRAADLERRAQK
ncbi:hypothetical protein STEG23_001285, partial [Scotinomys teguina]